MIGEILLFFSYAILHRLLILVFIPKLGPYVKDEKVHDQKHTSVLGVTHICRL